MKRLILFELLLLFLATTFKSDATGGWVQQTLPVNKLVNDIYFIDSLTGWIVESNTHYPPNDTGYILKTTDAGNSWAIQNDSLFNYYSIQFINANIGYAAGGTGRGKFLTTTNGGTTWVTTTPFGSNVYAILDISFVNKDTGWVCSDDSFGGGVFKTTNGGANWQQQLNNTFRPYKLFFINKDTGWVGTNNSSSSSLYKTTNGGANWNLLLSNIAVVESIFFLTPLKGWIRAIPGSNGVACTTDGGITWANGHGVNSGYDIKFVNDSIGYAGGGDSTFRNTKSTDGGKSWGHQVIPIFIALSNSMLKSDTVHGWAGYNGLINTTNGGGNIFPTGITQINSEVPKEFALFQNYPNPFNPKTNINYELRVTNYVKLIVYDIQGREITVLVNQKQSAGTYQVDFSGNNLSSGVYFYKLIVGDMKEEFTETRKMILLK